MRQVPHFSHEMVTRCRGKEIDSVFDIIEMENDDREGLLALSASQMTDVAKFCNRYPNIEMNHAVDDPQSAATGQPTMINITLEREADIVGNVIGKRDRD